MVVAFPVFAVILVVCAHLNFLCAMMLFFGLPSIYLSCRRPVLFRKSFIFALIFGSIFYLLLDPIAAVNGSWVINSTIFPRILGIITIENYFYAIGWVWYAVLFYRYFLQEKKDSNRIPSKIYYLVFPCAALIVMSFILFFAHPIALHIPYFYLIAGTVFALIPLLGFLYSHPGQLFTLVRAGLYFAGVLFLFEVAALKDHLWSFPGSEFIAYLRIGNIRFPLEELVIWIILATPSLIVYYMLFAEE